MANAASVTKLTEREKECLRAWLEHKTAKEIALDLGVSHYAVEKRLKMARIKLDVSSSIEAARILSESEGYDRAVPQAADLPANADPLQSRSFRKIAAGVALMTIIAIALVASVILNPEAPQQPPAGEAPATVRVEARPAEVLVYVPGAFADVDADGSGFIDGEEAPMVAFMGGDVELRRSRDGTVSYSADSIRLSSEEERGNFYRMADRDGDGRINPQEYGRWSSSTAAQDAS
ncbi:LuxR C-terminal-related transcriptional regulator [Aurantiacibacter gilvus]|uniref:LuxR C-terminal-related transcriptional regulator n=1 Tax=Aurantiacibacter gilvus TaxID=3139141 RepID=A0ABU9IC98_9SPHN